MGFLFGKRENGNFVERMRRNEESSIRSKVVEYVEMIEWIKQTFSSTVSFCVDINKLPYNDVWRATINSVMEIMEING